MEDDLRGMSSRGICMAEASRRVKLKFCHKKRILIYFPENWRYDVNSIHGIGEVPALSIKKERST